MGVGADGLELVEGVTGGRGQNCPAVQIIGQVHGVGGGSRLS